MCLASLLTNVHGPAWAVYKAIKCCEFANLSGVLTQTAPAEWATDATYCSASGSPHCGQQIDHGDIGQISIFHCAGRLISDAAGHPSSQRDGWQISEWSRIHWLHLSKRDIEQTETSAFDSEEWGRVSFTFKRWNSKKQLHCQAYHKSKLRAINKESDSTQTRSSTRRRYCMLLTSFLIFY